MTFCLWEMHVSMQTFGKSEPFSLSTEDKDEKALKLWGVEVELAIL